MDEFEEKNGSQMSPPPPPAQVGRIPIPKILLEERRDMELELKTAGLSNRSILREVNQLNSKKHWGSITVRTLERDIATYYRQGRDADSFEEADTFERLRDGHLAQIEHTIEQLVLHIAEKNRTNSWLAFEKVAALEKLHKMQVNFTELQGWNLSRARTTINVNNIKTSFIEPNSTEAWERADRALIKMGQEKREALAGEIRTIVEGNPNWHSDLTEALKFGEDEVETDVEPSLDID